MKNGINAFDKKNYLGAFAPPYAVINDQSFLKTLEDRDWRSGVAEAIKVALVKDRCFFEWLEAHAFALANRQMKPMAELVRRCAELHMIHIAGGDPFEMGSSRPLDFGHWTAHKLEQLTQYELRHGEAVAMGIALDTLYSRMKGLLDPDAAGRVLSLLDNLGFVLHVPALEEGAALLQGLREFQEHLGGELTIMLLEAIGRGVEVHHMDEPLILRGIKNSIF